MASGNPLLPKNKYFAYGLDFTNSTGLEAPLLCYSSVDLVNWKFNGVVAQVVGGRPHIIYNPTTKQYVLWSNLGTGYTIATSPAPALSFVDVGTAALDPQFAGLQPADHTVTTIGDKAYLTWSVLNFMDARAGSLWPPIFQTLHISPLTDDFLNTTQTSTNVTSAAFDLVDQQAESPDLFVRNGIYYVVASNTCGFCSGSIGVVYRSASLSGPWERDIVSAFTCGGQVEGVLPLTDPATNQTTYVWHATTTPGGPRISFSGHFFQPLRFNADGSVQDLDCSAGVEDTASFLVGDGTPDVGALTTATDATPRFADYQTVCDTDLFQRVIQTWTNSKAGLLSSVTVNLAAGGQTSGVQVVVFRFTDLADLVSPSFKFEQLGTATFTSAQVGTSFKAMQVPLNATVAQGDQLGFFISEGTNAAGVSSPNLIPYCHLEYNVGAANGSVAPQGQFVFQQGAGQNSLRGLQMNLSPVQVREGKGIKFFSTVT
ncbi:hypothetical protein N0V93_000010 [Gnomoniopsis smithogilvyi]|uniref:Glycoside hydrolase family 43 protein n=1 Tax=Gnomoniopsis smithogilvyi TaxID=1191159 RepID=A0A9W9D1B9_9PEZI|nr:hypothetical protein N0V93_000010 [Gnomoniopsis smithogilvyi]